jgi:hypothetical protein
MDLLNFWKLKKIPVPTRCTYCDYEDLFSEREIRNIQKDNKNDPQCDIRVECEICHNGYQIPIEYIDKRRNLYLYDKIKPNITNPDPKKLMQRIYGVK